MKDFFEPEIIQIAKKYNIIANRTYDNYNKNTTLKGSINNVYKFVEEVTKLNCYRNRTINNYIIAEDLYDIQKILFEQLQQSKYIID